MGLIQTVLVFLMLFGAEVNYPLPDVSQIFTINADMAVCPDAGPDTLVCGFQYTLMGNDSTGSWEVICSRSQGRVLFGNASEDTTVVMVEECGEYMFEYTVPVGPCAGVDTVIVKFEDPSSLVIDYGLETTLTLNAECHDSPPDVICDNTVDIPGQQPPSLDWDFCGIMNCITTSFSVQAGNVLDSCIVDSIGIDTSITQDFATNCSSGTDVTGADVLQLIGDALNIPVGCPLPPPQCFPIPEECIDTLLDTTILVIPIINGGLWHYVDINNNLIPLSDTTTLFIDGTEYALVINPSSAYYGPDAINVTIWRVLADGSWAQPTSRVEISIQWLITYRHDTLQIVDTIYEIKDSCDIIPCGGITVRPATITIPDPPDYPCGPVDIIFDVPPGDQFFNIELTCGQPIQSLEVCPGQFEEFLMPGFYSYQCDNGLGCVYNSNIQVVENFIEPVIANVLTQCDAPTGTYDLSFDVLSPNGVIDVEGVGVFASGQTVIVGGIPSCTEFNIIATDLLSECRSEEIAFDCCCQDVQVEFIETICAGESYEFNNTSYNTTGVYTESFNSIGGCDSTVILDLTVLDTSSSILRDTICNGDEVMFNGQSLASSGHYIHTSPGANGCDSTAHFFLWVRAEFPTFVEASICSDEVYEFNGVPLDQSGVYADTLLGMFGCDSIIQLDLAVIEPVIAEMRDSVCDGATYNFNGQLIDQPGIYLDTLLASSGCDSIVRLELDGTLPLVTRFDTVLCEGEEILLNGRVIAENGLYIDTFLTVSGCDSIVEMDVVVDRITAELATEPDCQNGSTGSVRIEVLSGGTPPYQYALQSVDNMDSLFLSSADEFNSLEAGNYEYLVKDSRGCENGGLITVPQLDSLANTTSAEYDLCGLDSLVIDLSQPPSVGDVEYSWNDGYDQPVRTIRNPGQFNLTVRNVCEEMVIGFAVRDESESLVDKIFVPNVFSPNGDQVNDDFRVTSKVPLADFELHIYDRWGNELRIFSSMDESWDGTFRGQAMNPGVYVWWLEATGEGCNGILERIRMKGDVTIVK